VCLCLRPESWRFSQTMGEILATEYISSKISFSFLSSLSARSDCNTELLGLEPWFVTLDSYMHQSM
jgi:hypothetical protein